MTDNQDDNTNTASVSAPPAVAALPGLAHIPPTLRIEVVHQDESILVVYKPCNLRSVPGNAEPPSLPQTGKRKARDDDDDTPTAQQAWVLAIQQLAEESGASPTTLETSQHHDNKDNDKTQPLIQPSWFQGLGGQPSQRASIPRKYAAFARYVQRSRRRIFGHDNEMDDLPQITQRLFQSIEQRQAEILQPHRPAPTKPEESVFGQVQLAGLGTDSKSNQDLFVVHRLDQQTSGLLVLARTAAAASFLSSCWRKRDRVNKVYRALVEAWPLEQQEGCIRLPMSPHPTERLKWVVDQEHGKECLTCWNVLEKCADGTVILELSPVTGRTHQLRVHCAATGGTIRGDSLYGTPGDMLYLHAETLSFPHPTTTQVVTFQVDPKW